MSTRFRSRGESKANAYPGLFISRRALAQCHLLRHQMGDILLAVRRKPPGVFRLLVPDGSRRSAKVGGIGR
jgi:hypothetical protein